MTNPETLARLKAGAEAATQGEWREGSLATVLGGPLDLTVAKAWGENLEADARHIANCDPPTILALLARLEELEARVANCAEGHGVTNG